MSQQKFEIDNPDVHLLKEEGDHAFKEGAWYLYQSDNHDQPLLVCIKKTGSNFVAWSSIHAYDNRGGWYSYSGRMSYADAYENLTYCPHAAPHLEKIKQSHIGNIQGIQQEIEALTKRLNLTPHSNQTSGSDLAVFGTTAIETYKGDLVKAKTELLPELFSTLKKATEKYTDTLKDENLPVQHLMDMNAKLLDKTDTLINNLDIYAGITESIKTIKQGAVSTHQEVIHVMQRKLYMDEESLLNVDFEEGMTFKNIGDFDNWLAKPDNLNRLLPFPKTIVAFQIRRKENSFSYLLQDHWMEKERNNAADKFTYFYVRNGENLYRIASALEFEDLIFPSEEHFKFDEQNYVKKHFREYFFKTKSEYDYDEAQFLEQERKKTEFKKNFPNFETWWAKSSEADKENYLESLDPDQLKSFLSASDDHQVGVGYFFKKFKWHFDHYIEPAAPKDRNEDYDLFNPQHLYFDEATEQIQKKFSYYNRVFLLLQGLLDRSNVLKPHAHFNLKDFSTYAGVIKLVRDGDFTLHYGEKPDIEAYFARARNLINKDSVFFGQEKYWMAEQADELNYQISKMTNGAQEGNIRYYRSSDNPGPDRVTKAHSISMKNRTATFRWLRESRTNWHVEVGARCVVPFNYLFNISAYRLGDYLQFFKDPRTRADYLKWAPALLAAEKYHRANSRAES